MALNRLANAHAIYQQPQARGLNLKGVAYRLAFLEGDMGMTAKIAASPANLDMSGANLAAYFGHLRKAREVSRGATDAALKARAKADVAYVAWSAALPEALLGNPALARKNASAALSQSAGASGHAGSGWSASWSGAPALALVGDSAQAGRLADQFGGRCPVDTVINNLWKPEIRAVIKLNKGKGDQAVDALEPAAALELSWVEPVLMPAYVRGQAYLMSHRGAEAAREFQENPRSPRDCLGLACRCPRAFPTRACLRPAGRHRQARAAYQDFLTLWKDADPDIPILKQAKAEYAKLP
jgi:hypothetical protein